MMILALEFSSNRRAVTVFDTVAGRIVVHVEEEYGTRTAMVLIDEALRAAGLEPTQIEMIAVGLGPGSNAGIRSAISIAQGWHLARNTAVVGIAKAEAPTAEALARAAAARKPEDPSTFAPVYDREVSFVKAPPPRSY
jgi:tRNA threonylcarbamoyladenosine biosynthesis protein TsaB